MVITNCHNGELNPAGMGGNADVFRGVHCGRQVAIKVVRLYVVNLDRSLSVGPSASSNWEIRT
jgi:hypothetical protein